MKKRILLDALYPEEMRVVVHDGKRILEYDYQSAGRKQLKGNIYLAKITRVEPSLQAAFIDYGADKHGFLPFQEIHPDYFNLPHGDKIKLASEQSAEPGEAGEENAALSEDAKRPNKKRRSRKPSKMEDSQEIVISEEVNEQEAAVTPVTDEMGAIDDGVERFDAGFSDAYSDLYKKYKIQEVIKKGQVILVQALKEERGNKGATFTSFLSLAAKYSVLMPNSERQGGISKKIMDASDRNRLKRIVDAIPLEKGSSVIIRTAGAGKEDTEIKRDCEYLIKLWNNIRSITLSSKAPSFIHAEGDLVIRTARDLCDNDTAEIVVQGAEAFNQVKDMMSKFSSSHSTKVKKYEDKVPIFTKYGIDAELSQLYNPIARLDSGGYIVINPTEALISIDVNSGKSTSERNIEETALKTNLEAISEIARQLKLRDLSGLIVIDFIDMMDNSNKRHVEKKLRDVFQYDKARVQIGTISPFGLLEMSRQRIRSSIIESNMVVCPHCSGKGFIRAPEHNAIHILKTIQAELMDGDFELVNIYAHPDVIVRLINNNLRDILRIEESFNTKICFNKEHNISIDSFSIARVKREERVKSDQPSLTDPYSFTHDEDSVNVYEKVEPKKDNSEFTNQNIDETAFSAKTFKPMQRKYKKFPKRRRGGRGEFNNERFNEARPKNSESPREGEDGFSFSKLWKKITS